MERTKACLLILLLLYLAIFTQKPVVHPPAVDRLNTTESDDNNRPEFEDLLGARFPKGGCLSRSERHLYARARSRFTPSTYLLQKLRHYEELHAKCAKSFTSFNASTDGCRFIVWMPYEGMGNRLLSLLSTFAYALSTDRVLLVDKDTDIHELLCDPFPGSSWFLPESFPVEWMRKSLDEHSEHRLGTIISKQFFSKRGGFCTKTLGNPDIAYVHMDWKSRNGFDKRFFCEKEQALLSDVPWLFILSNSYYIPGLYFVPSLREELHKLLPEPESVFFYLSRYLIHPSDKVWKKTTEYYNRYLRDADRLIGLQLRKFNLGSKETLLEQLLNCTKALASADKNNTTFLVTSLEEYFYHNIKDKFPGANVYTPSHEGRQRTGRVDHDTKVLMEMVLLSMSDVLVTSPRSTFGYVAHGLAGIRPWTLRGLEKTGVSESTCWRSPSSEPCYLTIPTSYDCACHGKSNATSREVIPYVAACRDDPFRGVQLVPD